jgi:hypothetical protein
VTIGQDGSRRAVEEGEHPSLGVGEFCLRAICSLAKSTSVKYGVWLTTTVMVFPGSVASLVNRSSLAHKASWPGVKLAEGDIALRPQAGKGKETMKGKAWGCPVGPAIVPGVSWAAAPGPLDAAEVRRAIGALLNEGVLPEASTSAEGVNKKWEKLARAPGELKTRKAAVSWPAEKKPAGKGKRIWGKTLPGIPTQRNRGRYWHYRTRGKIT